jgi:hypothetical protein
MHSLGGGGLFDSFPVLIVCSNIITLFSLRFSAGMWSFLAYDLDQSMGRMLPKFPVIVHHILQTRIFLNLVVCILLRLLDQVQGFPSNATLFQ